MTSRISIAALVLATGGCSLIDPTDSPAITFEERLCTSNADCLGLEETIVDNDGILDLTCLVIGTRCDTGRNRCEVSVERVLDADGDGVNATACGGDDCDDTRATVYPGAPEACDGVVDDCSATGGGTARSLEDEDGDQFSAANADCRSGAGAFPKTDCDDTNPNTFPGAPEACDGEINTCETLGSRDVEDVDHDGHSPPGADCATDSENVNVFAKDDCNDADGNTFPGASEVCDRKFNDCSSTLPRLSEDADNDGRASFLATCVGGPIPKDECVGADRDATTRYCAPTEIAPILMGYAGSRGIAALDFDGDTDVDVMLANDAGQLERCLSNGSASPTFACTVLNAAFPEIVTRFRVGQINGAGTFDIVFSSEDTTVPQLGYVAGGGAGAAISIGQPGEFNIGNFDADTDTDIVAEQGTTLVAFVNNGTGTFAGTTIDASLANPLGVAAARFDSDSVIDFVATTSAGVFVYLSGGSAFGTWTKTMLGATVAGPEALEAGDLDDDGDADFVVGNRDSGDVVVFLNAAGVFTPVSVVPVAMPQQRLLGVATFVLRDYDLDGDVDIGATSEDNDTIAWWETAGSMIWLRHDIVTDFDSVGGLAVGDLDRDGDEDLIATSIGASTVSWWRTHYVSDVRFMEQRVDRAFDSAHDAVLGDLDDDGDLDIVAAAFTPGNDVTAWINLDGVGIVLAEVPIDINFAAARSVKLGDLDGDEDVDVVALSATSILWWPNNDGVGRRFDASATVVTGLVGAQYLAVGDVDGDDDLDLVASVGVAAGSLNLYTNDGAGAFTASTLDAITSPREIAIADIDGDTRADIVVASAAGEVLLFTNSASGTFTRAAIQGTALPSATGIALGDVDRDDRLDVVAIGLLGEIRFLANTGTGFTSNLIASPIANSGSASVEVTDLDSDGDLDVVASLQGVNRLRWYESTTLDGTQWIAHEVSALAPGAGPTGIDVGDIDADGHVDVLSTLRFQGDVVWWKSDGAAWWNP